MRGVECWHGAASNRDASRPLLSDRTAMTRRSLLLGHSQRVRSNISRP